MKANTAEPMFGADPKREVRLQRGWRLRESLVKYVDGAADFGDKTKLIEDAIEIHRALAERIGPKEREAMQRFAKKEKLDLATDGAEVIARLFVRGLKSTDAER